MTGLLGPEKDAQNAHSFEAQSFGDFPALLLVEQNGVGLMFQGQFNCGTFALVKLSPGCPASQGLIGLQDLDPLGNLTPPNNG
ncbi:hypothetical protein [Prosthecobacter sp. SYSU 5D2]|uniref:hypothetical protein n=1 Tax=Prosthecobacter sp. SYSU 5D2 TaxID=3134134 RepID=UPI0031FE8933